MSEGTIYPTKYSPKRLINFGNLTHRSGASGIPDAVAELYGIERASPVAAPTFVFMVGSPGAGKSQGHAALQEKQGDKEAIFKSYNYAIINLDTLLESFVPFRIASSFGHSVQRCLGENYPVGTLDKKGKPSTKKFASLSCYGSKAANLGSFGFIDHEETRVELLKALTEKLAERRGVGRASEYVAELFSMISEVSAEAKGTAVVAAGKSIIDLNEEAIAYAISKHINIVYETTFSSIKKFNDLYEKLKVEGYKIVVFHIKDSEDHIKAKLIARQEFEMPYLDLPFYRFVIPSDSAVAEYIKKTDEVVKEIKAKSDAGSYDRTEVYEIDVSSSFDPSRLKGEVEFDFEAQIERLIRAYGLRSRRRSAAAETKMGGRRREGRYTRKHRHRRHQ